MYLKLTVELDEGIAAPHEDRDGCWTPISFQRGHHSSQPLDRYYPWAVGMRRKIEVGLAFPLLYKEHRLCSWELWSDGEQPKFLDRHPGSGVSTPADGLLIWEHKPRDMGAKTYAERYRDAQGFLEEYNAWCNGSCYYFQLETSDGEELDRCGGFYGEKWLTEWLQMSIQGCCGIDPQGVTVDRGLVLARRGRGNRYNELPELRKKLKPVGIVFRGDMSHVVEDVDFGLPALSEDEAEALENPDEDCVQTD